MVVLRISDVYNQEVADAVAKRNNLLQTELSRHEELSKELGTMKTTPGPW